MPKRPEPNTHWGFVVSQENGIFSYTAAKASKLAKKILLVLGETKLKIRSKLMLLSENPRAQGQYKIPPSLGRGVKPFAEISGIFC